MKWYDSIELTQKTLTLSRRSVLPPAELTVCRNSILGYTFEGNTKIALTKYDATYKEFELFLADGPVLSLRFYTLLPAGALPIYLEDVLSKMMEHLGDFHPYITTKILQIPSDKVMSALESVEPF